MKRRSCWGHPWRSSIACLLTSSFLLTTVPSLCIINKTHTHTSTLTVLPCRTPFGHYLSPLPPQSFLVTASDLICESSLPSLSFSFSLCLTHIYTHAHTLPRDADSTGADGRPGDDMLLKIRIPVNPLSASTLSLTSLSHRCQSLFHTVSHCHLLSLTLSPLLTHF